MSAGLTLVDRLGIEVLGLEGHDAKCACPQCGHEDGFRVHQETGVYHCYVCKIQGNDFGLAELLLGSKSGAMELLCDLGMRERTPVKGLKETKADLISAIARKKRVSIEHLLAFDAVPWPKGKSVIIPHWPPSTRDAWRAGKAVEPCSKYFVKAGDDKSVNKKNAPVGVFLHGVAPGPGDRVAITEGPFEGAAMLEHFVGDDKEYDIVIGLPGSALKTEFAPWLTDCSVDIFPDRDAGGDAGSLKTAKRLHGTAARVRIVQFPAEWAEKDGAGARDVLTRPNGVQMIRDAIQSAQEWGPASKPSSKAAGKAGEKIADDAIVYAQTDMGNAERFRDKSLSDVGYCYAWNSWLIYDGRRYAVDQVGGVVQRAKRVVREIFHEAINAESDADRDAILQHAQRSESAARIAAMLKLSQDEVPLLHANLDRNPWLLNCKNGTLDLRTGGLKPHDRSDFLTKLCPTTFDPDSHSETWDQFVSAIFNYDDELVAFIQRLCGYFLTGDVSEQILPIFKGSGSNGKSTFIEAFASTIGQDYALKAVSNLLLAKKHEAHPTEKADLFGKRFVFCVETSDGNRLDEALVKELTGGDRIRTRRMREDFWEFEPTHKLVLCTNHAPRVRDSGHGMWRRLVLIPFDVQFWNPSSGEQGEDHLKQDKDLPRKLRQESAGILAWAVRGCLSWQENGLKIPESVRLQTEQYRDSQDMLSQFLANCCEFNDGFVVSSSYAYKAYTFWSNDHFTNQKKFSEQLELRGFQKKKISSVYWLGFRVADGILPETKPVTGEAKVKASKCGDSDKDDDF